MAKMVFNETTIDESTGEVLHKRWVTKEALNRQKFIKMYLQDLSALRKLTHAQYRMLVELTIYLEYNTNVFYFNAERRAEVSKNIGVEINTVNKSLSRLMKDELILKITSGTYQMNPKYFFNGDEMERAKALEVILTYKINDKK